MNKNILKKNIIHSVLIYVINYAAPLISVPYLIVKLGFEGFGKISFTTAVASYLVLIVEYGFNVIGVRNISSNLKNSEKINEIYKSVMYAKLTLTFASIILLLVGMIVSQKIGEDAILHLACFGLVIGQALSQQWICQAIGKMRDLSMINVIAKVTNLVAIFVFVKNSDDVLSAILINSLTSILIGVFGMYVVILKYKIRPKNIKPNINEIYCELKNGFHLLKSNLSISIFNGGTIIAVGLLTNSMTVGYFSVAEKIVSILTTLQSPIASTFFPYFSTQIKKDKIKALQEIMQLKKIGIIAYLLILSIVYFLSDWIINALGGGGQGNTKELLIIMLASPLFVHIASIYGYQIIVNFGEERLYSKAIFISGVIGVLSMMILGVGFAEYGIAFSRTFFEFILCVLMVYNGRKVIKRNSI